MKKELSLLMTQKNYDSFLVIIFSKTHMSSDKNNDNKSTTIIFHQPVLDNIILFPTYFTYIIQTRLVAYQCL